jgi:hypothetical protein
MASHDAPVDLEALGVDFVVTPALARLLVELARRRLEREASMLQARPSKEEDGM